MVTGAEVAATGDFWYDTVAGALNEPMIFGPSFRGVEWTEAIQNEVYEIGKRHGFAVASEGGVEADERGARAVLAYNLDLIDNDEDTGPVARIGARVRTTVTDDDRRRSGAVLMRSAAFLGLGRDPDRRTAGLGVEIAGGVTFAPITESIFEANLVFGGKFEK